MKEYHPFNLIFRNGNTVNSKNWGYPVLFNGLDELQLIG